MKKYVKLFESWLNEAEEGASIDLKKLKIGEFFKLDPMTRVAVVKSILEAMVSTGYIKSGNKGTLPMEHVMVSNVKSDNATRVSLKSDYWYKLETKEEDNEKMLDRSVFELIFVYENLSMVPLFLYIIKKHEDPKSQIKGEPWMLDFSDNNPEREAVLDAAYEKPMSADMASKFINSSSSIAVMAQKELEMAMKSSKEKEA